jgi:uncharacterized protein (DUF4415 family)
MKTQLKPLTTPKGELRQNLTNEELARFRPAHEVLPDSLQKQLGMHRRGPQKTPTKVATSIRLSPDVLASFKATGSGWQKKIDEALRTFLREHPKF